MMSQLFNRPWIRTLALGATFILLIAQLWRSDQSRNETENTNTAGKDEPDGFVKDSRFLSFDKNGARIAMIDSPLIEQFEPEGLATMTSPSATLYDGASGQPWHLTADTGRFHQATDRLDLSGHVRVVRPLGENQSATLTTDQLTLDNDHRTVFTDQPVLITEAHGTTAAVGMKAWIDDRILELNSRVKGHYEPLKATHD